MENGTEHPTSSATKMYLGLGTYADVEGASLGSIFPELNIDMEHLNSESASEALRIIVTDEDKNIRHQRQNEDVDRWLSQSLSMLKSFTKCVNWSCTNGHHAQQAYVNLLALVCKLLLATTRFPNPCTDKAWAVDELKEICSNLMEWHLRESIPSLWCRLQLVKVLHCSAFCPFQNLTGAIGSLPASGRFMRG
jgi:hypothetical protein